MLSGWEFRFGLLTDNHNQASIIAAYLASRSGRNVVVIFTAGMAILDSGIELEWEAGALSVPKLDPLPIIWSQT